MLLLTENPKSPTGHIQQLTVRSGLTVEGTAGDLLTVVEVRGGKVHHRRQRSDFQTFFGVSYARAPFKCRRMSGTGGDNGAIQPHWSPLVDLQLGRS